MEAPDVKETTYTCDLCETGDLVHFVSATIMAGKLVQGEEKADGYKHICLKCVEAIQKWTLGDKP